MIRRVAMTAVMVAGLIGVCLGQAADEAATTKPGGEVIPPPEPMAVPLTWQFKVDIEPLRAAPFKLPDQKKPQLYWYLRYTVTNPDDVAQMFVPEFILYTDTGQVHRSGQAVPTAVFDHIRKLHNDPLLKTSTSMTRKLLTGRDNARTGVAIWPDFDPNAGAVDVFIGGLSGETKTIPLPEPVKATETNWKGERKVVTKSSLILSKTLHLRYRIPGEKGARRHVAPELVEREWVMR